MRLVAGCFTLLLIITTTATPLKNDQSLREPLTALDVLGSIVPNIRNATGKERELEAVTEKTPVTPEPAPPMYPLDNWVCGNNETIMNATYKMAAAMAPELMEYINDCCIVHDWCYEKQMGWKKCDKKMCNCFKHVGKESAAMTLGLMLTDCEGEMAKYSQDAYAAAGNRSRLLEAIRHPHDGERVIVISDEVVLFMLLTVFAISCILAYYIASVCKRSHKSEQPDTFNKSAKSEHPTWSLGHNGYKYHSANHL